MSVYKKLNQARLELQNTKLTKSGNNKFAGYQYFELGDFLPAINNIFANVGLCGVVSFGRELATLTITDTEDNSNIVITSPMESANLKGCHPIQNLGAVETYTRRYLWVTALEIVEHDALDATTGNDKVQSPKESAKTIAMDFWEKLSPEEQNFLTNIAVEITASLVDNDLKEAHRLFYANNLTQEEQTALWSRLDSKQRKTIKDYSDNLKKAGN